MLLNLLLTPDHGAVASARITWATEALVVAIPLACVAVASRGGRRTAAKIALLVGCTVVASELAATERLPAVVVGAALVAVVLALAGRSVRWAAGTIAAERGAGTPLSP